MTKLKIVRSILNNRKTAGHALFDFRDPAYRLPVDGPTGTWNLCEAGFRANGERIAESGLPARVVQKGGCRTWTPDANARQLFEVLLYEG